MSKISFLKIANFLGVEEQEIEASKINIFRGPKGKGKSSILEAIEKTFTNKNRRTEVVKHGNDEAALYVELDDGLEINRRIRTEKADYLKVRKNDEGVPSTEKFLRDLVNGNIFRPIDWVNLSTKEQTKSLLSMLQIGWSEQDIVNWFGYLVDDIDYSQHILLILKSIETKYYKIREEVNREIKELKARINALYEELPGEYDGEAWKDKNVQEYYKKVSDAQSINNFINQARALKENFDTRVEKIKANGESLKDKVILKYKNESEDIKDIIALSNIKIEKAKEQLENLDSEIEASCSDIDKNAELKIQQIIFEIKQKAEIDKTNERKNAEIYREEQKDLININKNKIATKDQELVLLAEREESEKLAIDESVKTNIEKEEIRIGKASEYLETHEEIDVEPLQDEANRVQEMVSYLRDWDRISEIRDNQLAGKERYSQELSQGIDKARSLPSELIQTAKMPIGGISVDVDGRVRINETLIDGLSDGERLELAMKIAKAQCGELKVICLDKFESLDKASQAILLKEMLEDEYQYFVTEVSDTENGALEVEKIGEVS